LRFQTANGHDASTILDASEMSATRSVADFVFWVEGKTQELSGGSEARRFARSGAHLPKKFYDELYPFALFVEHEFSTTPNAIVTPNLGNDNFDAMISFGNGGNPLYIEITRAKDGHDESLRDEVLTHEGAVCLTGPIQKVEGRRRTHGRTIEIQNEAICHEVLLHKNLSLVKSAIKAKVNRLYGKCHLLLLVVDDYLPFRQKSDHHALHSMIRNELLSLDLDFMRLVVLGISGGLVLSYQLPKYAQPKTAL